MKLLHPKIKSHSPKEYHEYVKSLYVEPETSSGSHSVSGVGVSFTGKINKDGSEKVILRVTREPKVVTTVEIKKLAEEYGQPYERVLKLFKEKKRKITVREGK